MTDTIDGEVPSARTDVVTAAGGGAEKSVVFSFGDPEPVLTRGALLDNIECWRNGRWYEPPVSLPGLSRTFKAAPHHSSAIWVKVNLLTSTFIPHPLLSRAEFKAMALDYLVMGNGYLEERRNRLGGAMTYKRSPAKYTRRGVDLDRYFFLTNQALGGVYGEHEFEAGSIVHLQTPDLDQEIYGLPEYLSALQATFLNEAATIFRRRYYQNGSHAGFILYATDSTLNDGDVDGLRTALKDSKGPGNFRNIFMYAPGGKKDGIQLLPVGEVAAKDEFLGIKNTSRDDILAAHRVPPQLIGVVPSNTGGFGDVQKAAQIFYINEIEPLQSVFLSINDMLGRDVVRFGDYKLMSLPASPAAAGGQ